MFATNQIKSSYDHSGVQCMPFLFVGTSGKIQMSIQELAFEYQSVGLAYHLWCV